MKVTFIVVFFVGLLGNSIDAEVLKESVQTIDHPDKNEYISSLTGTDKHKYGYELRENRHFHHTTTEEDGVRLGCYGYVLNGKKYSTQYVADVKGYRPVFTHDLISVFPKSGDERKASFVGDFNEDQQRSENIRYFFPDGCKGFEITILPPFKNPPPAKTFVKIEEPISPPSRIITPPPPSPSTTPRPPPAPPVTPSPSTPLRTPPSQAPTPKTPPTQAPPTPPKTPATPKPPAPSPPPVNPFVPPSNEQKNACVKTCASDDDSGAKLVIPVPLKNLGKSGSCERFAKLVIPVDGLNSDSLRSLTKGSDTSELLRTVLQSIA